MSKTEAATTVDSQTKDNKQEKSSVKRNREDKLRKKDDKSVDHVLKALSSLETTEEKLGAMCQKYAEMFNDHRILQNAAKVAEKKNCILQKEKEQLQAEHSKAILTRSRLENLCRELQRQNKAVKEECMLKIREEEEKKREVAAKFQSTLTELGNLLAQNNDKNAKLRDDNLDMTTKLKNVCEQYEKKEQHVEKMAKQMHLEMQLANTKLAKAKMEMALEKEALLRDNQQLLLELKDNKKQLEEMKTSEIALRSQIQLYNDKYDEFHKALLQSNDAIGSFKQEMERMAKQIRKLEKETVAWKRRYETTHRTLLQMTEEKIKSDETASVSERRLTALQGLCRSLQAQCNHLREINKAQAAGTGTEGGAACAAVLAGVDESLVKVQASMTGTGESEMVVVEEKTSGIEVRSGESAETEEINSEVLGGQTIAIENISTESSETLIKPQTPTTLDNAEILSAEQVSETQTNPTKNDETELKTPSVETNEIQSSSLKSDKPHEAKTETDKPDSIPLKEESLETQTSVQNGPESIENSVQIESVALQSDVCSCNEELVENSFNKTVSEIEKTLSVTTNINGCSKEENEKTLAVENLVNENLTPSGTEVSLSNGNEDPSPAVKSNSSEERISAVNPGSVNSAASTGSVSTCSNGLVGEKSTLNEPSRQPQQGQGKKSKNKRKKSGSTAK